MKRKLLLSLSILLVLLASPALVSAEEQPYTVKPILPDNQDQGITNYISISADGDDLKQEIEFSIVNNTDEKMEIFIEPVNALTSPSGVIQYIPIIQETNSMLIDESYSLREHIDVNDSITLNKGEREIVNALIDISDIEGTILGAISFQMMQERDTQEQDNQQFKINNEINTTIGVQVNFDSSEEPIFEIGQPFVDPLPSYWGTANISEILYAKQIST